MVMSIVTGLFFLENGARTAGPPSTKPNASNTSTIYRNYICYDAHLLTSNPSFGDFPATIHYYSPERPHKDDKKEYLGVLPNGTAVIAIAKLAITPSKHPGIRGALLEAIDIFPIPGDPDNEGGDEGDSSDEESYDDRVPSFQFPFVSGAGHVTGPEKKLEGGKGGRVVPVVVEQFVNRTSYKFDVECFYDASPRWANVPAPDIGSCMAFAGECESYQPNGVLRIALKNIVLSCQPQQSVQPAIASPSKKRKFTAVLPVPARPNPLAAPANATQPVIQTPGAGPSNTTHSSPAAASAPATSPKQTKKIKKETTKKPGVRSSARGKLPVLDAAEGNDGDTVGVAAQQGETGEMGELGEAV